MFEAMFWFDIYSTIPDLKDLRSSQSDVDKFVRRVFDAVISTGEKKMERTNIKGNKTIKYLNKPESKKDSENKIWLFEKLIK